MRLARYVRRAAPRGIYRYISKLVACSTNERLNLDLISKQWQDCTGNYTGHPSTSTSTSEFE